MIKWYRIYGKMEGMKKMRPVSGDSFAINLIHAEVFKVETEEDQKELDAEIAYLSLQGEFELREVKELRGIK